MKYMGGKSRIAPFIAERINNIALCEGIKNYYEPFMGGCSVGELVLIENRFMSDLNLPLVELFKKVQSDIFDYRYIDRDEWYKAKEDKDTFKEFEPWEIGWIATACSFRGRPFASHAGKFIDNGNMRDPQLGTYNSLVKEVPLLQGIEFRHCSYQDIGKPFHSIIYCDAPYRGRKQYQMVDKFDFDEYDKWLISMAKENLVLISEYSMIGNYSQSFELLETWSLDSCIGSGNTDNNTAMEALFYVKNGWMTDKYFSNTGELEDITDF